MYSLYFTEGFQKVFINSSRVTIMVIPQHAGIILIYIYIGVDMIQADFLFHILGMVITNNNNKEIRIPICSSFYS